jgi:PAS domain S-box-containing protein
MRLQTKLISGILPVILISVCSLGLWISSYMSSHIREVYHSRLTESLQAYTRDELSRRYTLLERSRLHEVPSFVESYQQEALASATDYLDPAGGNMLILSHDGKLLRNTDSGTLPQYAIDEKITPILQASASAPDSYQRGTLTIAQTRHIYTSTVFAPWNWTVVFLKSTQTLEATLNHLYMATAGAAALCVVCSSLVIFLLLRIFFVKPVTTLRDATRRIAGGQKAELQTMRSGDELGQLARSMEEMQERLHEYSLEQKQLQEATRLSRDRLELIINGARLGTWEWDIGSGRVIFNERWAEIIGYRLDEIEHNVATWERIVHPDEQEDISRNLSAHLEGRTPYYMTEHRLRHKSGEWLWVLDVGKVFRWDEAGNPLAAAGIHLDITDRKIEADLLAAKESAIAASKAKSIFLSNMSHELRTPLNAIMGYTQLLRSDETLGAKQLAGVNTIHKAGEHLLMLIKDILDLSRIEAGRLELTPVPLMLGPFLATIRDIIQVRSDAKGLTFNYEAGDNLPVAIEADGLRLRQVLLNLLSNSVKFTVSGYCSLRVDSEFMPGNTARLYFTVEDSGPGIPEKIRERIFEPFQQFGELHSQAEGSGLGLTISSQLTALMKGDLNLTSPVKKTEAAGDIGGPGSRFVFSAVFPVLGGRRPISEVTRERSCAIVGMETGSKTILVVDDKSSNRKVIQDTLQHFGFATCEADDGSRVTAACERYRPDLILMDLRMPEVDGFGALDTIRKHEVFHSTPVIAVTASATEQEPLKKRCLERGFSGFLVKPYSTPELLELIAHNLGLRIRYFTLETEPAEPLVPPPPKLLERLRGHLQDGDMDALAGMARQLCETDSGRYRVFADRLNESAAEMRIAEIEKLLEDPLKQR